MFKKKNTSTKSVKPKEFSTTLISKSTTVEGDVKFSGDLEIQGTIKGNVIAVDKEYAAVKVVNGGKVEGDIQAPKIMINGDIEGDVYSSDFVELAEKARIKGNVHYHLFEMVKGAAVNGSLVHASATPNADVDKASDDSKAPNIMPKDLKGEKA